SASTTATLRRKAWRGRGGSSDCWRRRSPGGGSQILAGREEVVTTSRPLGVAIQGAGNVSTEHIRAYQRNPHTEVVAIGSRREEGARAKAAQMGVECAIYTDYDKLLAHPGVDIVSICTSHDRHAIETIGAA